MHDIIGEAKKKAVIISHLTIPVYETIKCVLHPLLPSDATVTSAKLLATIKGQYHQEKNKNEARHEFANVKQRTGESVAEFCVQLRKVAMACDFMACLDER